MSSDEVGHHRIHLVREFDVMAVAATFDNLEFGALDPPGQELGVRRGVEGVRPSVSDQDRSGDPGQLVPGFVTFAGGVVELGQRGWQGRDEVPPPGRVEPVRVVLAKGRGNICSRMKSVRADGFWSERMARSTSADRRKP